MIGNDLFDLKNKTAIVTGGAGYLGSAMSEALAQYGANVIIASRDVKKCSELAEKIGDQCGSTVTGEYLDIGDLESMKELYRNAFEKFGRIDVLVNNAAYVNGNTVENCDYDAWGESMDGTINGVYKCVREVLPYMKEQGGGRIINIASMYGLFSPNPSIYAKTPGQNSPPGYGTGKAAVIQFTKYIAAYYGKYGILSNAICPGSFPHPETQKDADFTKLLSDRAMLGRIGRPDEIKGIVVYLASDASSYTTGQAISVDGGTVSW